MSSRNSASAEYHHWSGKHISVTVESADFRGVVTLDLEGAKSLMEDLRSCIEDLEGRPR